MKAGDFTFKEAAQIMAKLDAEGLAIYKKKTPKLTRATIHKEGMKANDRTNSF